MKRTQAERRHQFYRYRAKAVKIVKGQWWRDTEDKESLLDHARVIEKNRKKCSCYMCGHARDMEGPNMQEKRERLRTRQSLTDWRTNES